MGRTIRVLVAAVGVLVVMATAPAARATDDTTKPTAPQNLHITTTTETTLTLAWTPSTDNVGVDHYRVYRDGSVVGTPGQSDAPTFTDTGLWPHSTHSFYVDAVDAAGNASPISNLITGNTKIDLTPPSAPTNLVATFNRDGMYVSLTWGPSTDNVGVDHYEIYRNLVKIGSRPPSALTYLDTTVPSNSTVKYLVVAVDFFGNTSQSSNQPIAITDTLPPTAPSNLQVTAATATSMSLGWSASTDNFMVSTYDIYRNGTKIATQSAATGPTFYVGGLTAATTYQYFVIANDATGNSSPQSNTVSGTTTGGSGGDTTPPTAPSDLAAAPIQKKVDLTWNASTDNQAVVSYKINRNGSLLATTNGLGFTDSEAPDNTDLAYTVVATDAAGNVSPQSNQATTYVDTLAPSTPSSFQAADDGSSVNLQWAASTDNVAVTSYVIARGTLVVAETTGLSYVDATAPANRSINYTVTAKDAAGNQSVAATMTVVTGAHAAIPDYAGGFVSDTTPTSSTGTFRVNHSAIGKLLRLNGVSYAKGLGTTAPPRS
jgi:chitodextrinase